MKQLKQFIFEKRHVSSDVLAMTDYIYNMLEEFVNTPADDPKYKTMAYELCKADGLNEYDIEINFEDIPNFNWNNHKLLSGKYVPDWEYKSDFVVQLTDMDAFGTMQTDEPILQVGVKFLRSPRTFKSRESELRNTLIHELTHYIQYFAGMMGMLSGKFTQRPSSGYDSEFTDQVNDYIANYRSIDNKYYCTSFLIYAFQKNERFARVAGFHGTVATEFDILLKEFRKLNKRHPGKEEFIDFVVNNHKYDENVIHLDMYDKFIKNLENDTYENFKACVEDTTTIFREDSQLYVLMNLCDHLEPRPTWLIAKNMCIYNTRTKEDFEKARKLVLDRFTKNYNQYKKNLADIVEDIWDEYKKK